jgi:hypothetical protein
MLYFGPGGKLLDRKVLFIHGVRLFAGFARMSEMKDMSEMSDFEDTHQENM